MKKVTTKETIILNEIKNNIIKFHAGNSNEPMIYLGFPSEVKTLVRKGVLTPYSKETKRILNWYNLTAKGINLIDNLK
jgi:hypothetical protein